jgi:energy-coupling factor transporter ATP-binding protein EcfA2
MTATADAFRSLEPHVAEGHPLLEVDDLVMHYRTRAGEVNAIDGVGFTLNKGQAIGLVGESGCGKTSIALTLLRLLPQNAAILRGSVRLAGTVAASLFLLVPMLSGCDGGSPGPDFPDMGIRVETFTPRANQFAVTADRDVATFERQSQILTSAAVDHGVVLLYARGDLIFLGESGTWAALPYTQGIERFDEELELVYVDFTITFEGDDTQPRLAQHLRGGRAAGAAADDHDVDRLGVRLVDHGRTSRS